MPSEETKPYNPILTGTLSPPTALYLSVSGALGFESLKTVKLHNSFHCTPSVGRDRHDVVLLASAKFDKTQVGPLPMNAVMALGIASVHHPSRARPQSRSPDATVIHSIDGAILEDRDVMITGSFPGAIKAEDYLRHGGPVKLERHASHSLNQRLVHERAQAVNRCQLVAPAMR